MSTVDDLTEKPPATLVPALLGKTAPSQIDQNREGLFYACGERCYDVSKGERFRVEEADPALRDVFPCDGQGFTRQR